MPGNGHPPTAIPFQMISFISFVGQKNSVLHTHTHVHTHTHTTPGSTFRRLRELGGVIIWARHWLDKIKVGLVPKLGGLYFISYDLSLTLAMTSSQHLLSAPGRRAYAVKQSGLSRGVLFQPRLQVATLDKGQDQEGPRAPEETVRERQSTSVFFRMT